MRVQAILSAAGAMVVVACAPTAPPEASAPQPAAKPATQATPEKPVDVSPGSPPEAHPLAPEAVPNKPQTILEVMPGATPPR
jgi:hypothetical protein